MLLVQTGPGHYALAFCSYGGSRVCYKKQRERDSGSRYSQQSGQELIQTGRLGPSGQWLVRLSSAYPPVVDNHVRKAAIDIGLLNGEFWTGGRAAWELAGCIHAGDLTSHPACCTTTHTMHASERIV